MRTTTILTLVMLTAASFAGCKKDECSNTEDCDDGVYCNGSERCVNGSCVGGVNVNCDDGIDSTEDVCNEELNECVHDCIDLDGDGHLSEDCDGGDDCDDTDAEIHPDATEWCDGVDDDCDGTIWEDVDSDGYLSEALCPAAGGDDCDDTNDEIHPGAEEICDGVDNNCADGTDDEADTDDDGHDEIGCSSAPGGDDCDDEDPSTYPGATEVCDGADNDCTGTCDDDFDCCAGVDEVLCWTTCLSVGIGTCTDECGPPDGLTACNPPAEECNGEDDDCDTIPDDGFDCIAEATVECTTECDTLGTGDCSADCDLPLAEDCNPPTEECNGIDDDCDGACDESFDCCAGEEVECVTTCDSINMLPCTDECQVLDATTCTLVAELDCTDGQDDDCDFYIDEFDTDCM